MRQAEKKYFGDIQQGRLNADDSALIVGQNEWINAENVRTGSTDKGYTGIMESVGGNELIEEPNAIGVFYLNIEQNGQGSYVLSQTKSTTRTSAVSTWDIGNSVPPVGTQIQGSINDPNYGLIGILNYVVKSTDINVFILAKSLSNNINVSSLIYGYTSTCLNNIIKIYSRPDAGTVLNGLSIQNISIGTITPFQFGINNFIVANNNDTITWITNINALNNAKINKGVFDVKLTLSHSSTSSPNIRVYAYSIHNGLVYNLGNERKIIQNKTLITYDFNINVQPINAFADYIGIDVLVENVSNGSVTIYPQSAEIINKKEIYSYSSTNIFNRTSLNYDYITIGSVEDTENKRIVYFNYDNSPVREDCIICYYTELNKQYVVLSSSQVLGGLNFDKNSLIHSAKISNGSTLSWTDGTNNEPRKINIESGIKSNDSSFQTDAKEYTLPLNFSEITLIKRPPAYTPNIFKKNDPLFLNNLIQYDSFEFAFQYEYYDNEISVVGSYSEGSKLNYPTYTSSPPNYIEVDMDLREIVPNTVKLINLIVRISDGTNNGGVNAFIVKTWNKNNDDDNQAIINHNIGNSALSYNFYNNITGQYLAQDDVLRAFDNVPIFSQTHEVSKSRYFLANNVEGYNAPATTSLQAAMSNIVNITLLAPPYAVFSYKFTAGDPVTDWHQTFNPIVGYQYRWSYWGYYIWATANTPNGIQTGYFELSRNYNLDNGYGTVFPTLRPYPSDPTFPSTITVGSLKYMGTNQAEIERNASIYVHQLNPYYYNSPLVQERLWANAGQTNVSGLSSNYYNVFPQLSTYKFGVVFYDYAMRKCSVVPRTTTGNQLFYTFDFNVEGSTPDEIIVHDDISTYLVVGDTIVISGSTGIEIGRAHV